ncbi:MAG: pantoate kinase [Promethearchaeota archaeon]
MADTLMMQQDTAQTAKAFVPGHVTGIFRIFDEYDDPLRCGSIGAGFSVAIGTETTVSVMDHSSLEITTEYNNERIDAKVTKTVVRRLTDDYERKLKVHVTHDSSLISGAGFGASGAGALGTAYALGYLLDNEMSPVKAASYAHIAEVVNRTGLGDVISQTVGGIEVRKKPGSPGIGATLKISHDNSLRVVLAGAQGLDTSEVLSNPDYRNRINTVGDELVSRIIHDLKMETFIQCSREFSEAIGLKTERVKAALLDLESNGFPNSGMVMLGDSVFCFCENSETSKIKDILTNYWGTTEVFVTEISDLGGRLL